MYSEQGKVKAALAVDRRHKAVGDAASVSQRQVWRPFGADDDLRILQAENREP
jgi:hypothetical protein